MIVGNGLLARGFIDNKENYPECVIFASGVSNSMESSELAFNRETELLKKTIADNPDKKIIYFSSILVDTLHNNYYEHKSNMEAIVKSTNSYLIFRIPQVIGNGGNNNNLVNHIKNTIISYGEVKIYSGVERALVDIVDLERLVGYCKHLKNETICLSHIEKTSVFEITKKIGEILSIEPSVIYDTTIDTNWQVENSDIINEAIKKLKINVDGYTGEIIKKYIKW